MKLIRITLLLVLQLSFQNAFADIFFEDTAHPDKFENRSSGYQISLTQYDTTKVPGNQDLALSIDRFSFLAERSHDIGSGHLQTAVWYESSIYEFGLGDRTKGQSMGIEGTYSKMIGDNWAAYGRLLLSSQAEDDATFSEGLVGAAGFGFQREWENGLSLGLGILGQPEAIERNASLAVLPELKWRLSERTRLLLSSDAGLSLAIDLSKSRRTFLELGIREEIRGYRLRDFAFDSRKDTSVFESAPVGVVQLHHRFENGWHMKLSAGYTGNREFKFYSNGREINAFESDGGTFFGLSFGIRF